MFIEVQDNALPGSHDINPCFGDTGVEVAVLLVGGWVDEGGVNSLYDNSLYDNSLQSVCYLLSLQLFPLKNRTSFQLHD